MRLIVLSNYLRTCICCFWASLCFATERNRFRAPIVFIFSLSTSLARLSNILIKSSEFFSKSVISAKLFIVVTLIYATFQAKLNVQQECNWRSNIQCNFLNQSFFLQLYSLFILCHSLHNLNVTNVTYSTRNSHILPSVYSFD